MKRDPLSRLISAAQLAALAGERSWERGRDYFEHGAVERLVTHGTQITARVSGTETYTVKLWTNGKALDWDCTCPMGEDGDFCKHAVATGLAWLAERQDGTAPAEGGDLASIRKYLEKFDKGALLEIILARAAEDENFADALLVEAQRRGVTDPASVQKLIREALSPRGFIDYRHMRAFAARASLIPDLLRGLLRADAETALELTADAIGRALKSLQHVDDSDGALGSVIEELADVHLDAAGKSGMAPEQLAAAVFDLQRQDGFGFFALESYLPLLGERGLAAYRKRATAAWKKLPPLRSGDDERAEADPHRHEITHIMETLARLDGDSDALVDVLRRDLSQPWHYLKIAETLAEASRHEAALKWAEDGRAAFAGEPMIPLDEFLVKAWQRAGRHDEAIALLWSRFDAAPSLDDYRKLKEAAEEIKEWPAWRDKVLARLRRKKATGGPRNGDFGWMEPDREGTTLVQIHLWEGDPRAALEVARKTACSTHLWQALARALEADHPGEAIAIYQAQIEPIVSLTNNDAYDDAAKIVSQVRTLMQQSDRAAEFQSWLDTLRTQHKAKRNFMKRLEPFTAADRNGNGFGATAPTPAQDHF